MEAEGPQEAIRRVKELGIYPREVAEFGQEERWRPFRKSSGISLPHFTRQVGILLSAGVPLMEALRSVAEESDAWGREILVRLRERVAAGASLSRALEDWHGLFPPYYVNMVAAGEQSGILDRVFQGLADFLEKQSAIGAKIRTAMIYPAFMVSMGFLVISFLFTFVMPKIVKIFADTQTVLPFITIVLIKVSNLFVNFWWLILLSLVAAFWGAERVRKKRRELVDAWKLRFLGRIGQYLYLARFSRILGLLLQGGLPMLRALELAGKSVGNRVLEKKIEEVAKRVMEGASLSASLEGFPPILRQLVATGEKSGKLDEVLGRAADSYEEEFSRRVQMALSLLEPLMILAMAGVVGLIVLAVLLPIFQLNQLVK